MSIVSNVIRGIEFVGIGIQCPLRNSVISSNTISRTGRHGLQFTEATNSVNVIGNSFYDVAKTDEGVLRGCISIANNTHTRMNIALNQFNPNSLNANSCHIYVAGGTLTNSKIQLNQYAKPATTNLSGTYTDGGGNSIET